MNVDVSGTRRTDVNEHELGEFAASILDRESVDAEAVLSIAFVDEEAITRLNTEHMGRTHATDVLSFAIEDASPDRPPVRDVSGPPLELGDVFVCADVVEAHAIEYGVSFRSELHLVIVHGVLHILGWDHQTVSEAEAMEEREAEHLATIGLDRR
ncbi:MAG: rRNA maturation RNase YbeY [Acidimicrobiia bacterium]|nr:MAG: rRNA maturation RNase YbeY [Acidimicrobiia bacterium]